MSGSASRAAKDCGRCIKIPQSWFNSQTTPPSTAKSVDQEMLEGLRSDAFQIRLCVLLALGQYVFSASSVGAAVNAHRAVATYSAMLVRLTAFIQEYSTPLFPSYLDAVA